MKSVKVDHSSQVGQRILAIRIAPEDYCSFFKKRDNCPLFETSCYTCEYAVFEKYNQQKIDGLCKFKRNR